MTIDLEVRRSPFLLRGRHVGESYGCGNPRYTFMIMNEEVRELLLSQPEDIVEFDGRRMTYGDFQKILKNSVLYIPEMRYPTDY